MNFDNEESNRTGNTLIICRSRRAEFHTGGGVKHAECGLRS